MNYRADILLFDNFETLDVFGPVEILGKLPDIFKLNFISYNGGFVKSSQNVRVDTNLYSTESDMKKILLIPGGYGTRQKVNDDDYIKYIKSISEQSDYVLTVCTGSALLAKTGILNKKKATSNKNAFKWVMEQGKDVSWVKKARWVKSGNIYTSSGVSAGIDMALGFVKDLVGEKAALEISRGIEYVWNKNSKDDPFFEL